MASSLSTTGSSHTTGSRSTTARLVRRRLRGCADRCRESLLESRRHCVGSSHSSAPSGHDHNLHPTVFGGAKPEGDDLGTGDQDARPLCDDRSAVIDVGDRGPWDPCHCGPGEGGHVLQCRIDEHSATRFICHVCQPSTPFRSTVVHRRTARGVNHDNLPLSCLSCLTCLTCLTCLSCLTWGTGALAAVRAERHRSRSPSHGLSPSADPAVVSRRPRLQVTNRTRFTPIA
jgi:hypothetical protein